MAQEGLLSRLAATFDPSTLVGHFVLGRSIPLLPDGWATHTVDGWRVATDARLPVTELRDADDEQVGWVLGYLLALGVGPARLPLRVPARATDVDFHGSLERWLYGHAGTFVVVLARPAPRVFLDPFGALPVLFDRTLEAASSSPFLLTTDGDYEDSPAAKALDIARTGSWLILGTTPLARAERVVPNHFLDLQTWTTHRHWPAGAIEPGDATVHIARLADAIDGAMLAAARSGSANVSLTAGADSRLMLACARGYVEQLRFFTVPFPDRSGDIDAGTAPRIAARFGLTHRTLRWIRPAQTDIDRFLFQTGGLIGEYRGRQAGPSYAQLGADDPYISGVGTITARPAHQVGLSTTGEPLEPTDAAWLLRYFGFPPLPELLTRAERWLEEAPPLDPHNLRVLFHMEMRYGAWGGALAQSYPAGCSYTLYPFGQRAVADAIFGLPLDYRLTGLARRDATALRWAELLEFEINRPTRRAVVTSRLRRASQLPAGAVRRSKRFLRRAIRALGRSTTP